MATLQDHLHVQVKSRASQHDQLVHAPNEPLRMIPFKFSYLHLALYSILGVTTGGLIFVFSVWYPQIFTYLARTQLPFSLVGDADYILVLIYGKGLQAQWIECKVNRNVDSDNSGIKSAWAWFEFKKHRYIYSLEEGKFNRYLATTREDLGAIFARIDNGLSTVEANSRFERFGANRVLVDKPSIPMLLFRKLIAPFYIFQVISAIIWFFEAYTVYAVIIVILSATSITNEIYVEVSNSNRLRSLVKSDCSIHVVRAGTATQVHESELVPGDIVDVKEGPVCADILLLSGLCVADEASLTGEAVPVNKEPAVGTGEITEILARSQYRASCLHAGSTIIRVREGGDTCRGVVLSTGFSTGRGELFRSILFPKPISFEFERDSYRYLIVLWSIAIAAFIKRVVDGAGTNIPFFDTLLHSLDLITIAVPPALPLVLSSGIGFAMQRLQNGGIFCIDSRRVNSCGQITCYCFDKTGTLTKEHLSFVGVDNPEAEFGSPSLDMSPQATLAMATCHSLSKHDGNLQGYPLEVAMFNASQFDLESLHEQAKGSYIAMVTSTENASKKYGIMKRFAFDAAHQRSSTIVEEVETKKRFVVVKGSPEAICAISTSTPANLRQKVHAYSADGYYCIGFGMKELGSDTVLIDQIIREDVECTVEFQGLAIFKNELKPETKGMLDELLQAKIDVRIITGDNALTAIHVCRELEMPLKSKIAVVDVDATSGSIVFISADSIKTSASAQWESFNSNTMNETMAEYDLAITGSALEKIRKDCGDETIQQIIKQTPIFARVRPQQKTWIVEHLIETGLIVGMCGDGTNDCGALKAAHVGLALSCAEASIVAPFTSKAKAILDVPVLLREGRCALTTSFQSFKFMCLYPIIQLGMAVVLAQVGVSAGTELVLNNNQYVWDDMAIVLGLSIAMLYTGPTYKLSPEKPPNTLFSPSIVASIVGQVTIFIAGFASAFAVLHHSDSWFCSIKDGLAYVNGGDLIVSSTCAIFMNYDMEALEYSYEDTTTWLFVHLSYIVVAIAFNIMKDPFRLPFYTNRIFTTLTILPLGVNLWFLLDTSGVINDTFQVMPIPFSFRWKLLLLFIAELVIASAWELVATQFLPKWCSRKTTRS